MHADRKWDSGIDSRCSHAGRCCGAVVWVGDGAKDFFLGDSLQPASRDSINQASTKHQPSINQASTKHQPSINQASTSSKHRPARRGLGYLQ
ncbi:hypothetical protein [Planctomycetes bacterium SV_7m_r]|uniref:hypothetical protein n=1 Tax=Stieleria bergensis TaxID=2528025 RepID=UPI0011A27D5B